MVNNEYEEFIGKDIYVITRGVTSCDAYKSGIGSFSIQLEGILDKETEDNIFLKNIKTYSAKSGEYVYISPRGVVRKDQLVSILLVPQKVSKKAKGTSELITEEPKPA